MISCTTIGSNGRLGNQMFQFAALLGISSKLGHKIHFSPGRLYEAFKMTGITNEYHVSPLYLYREPSFSYTKSVYEIPDNTEILGYFQSSKYWEFVDNKVVEAFEFRDEQKNISADIVDFAKNSISVHVRRTDYLTSNGYHPVVGSDYIIKGIQAISKKLDDSSMNISIFTDDPVGIKNVTDEIMSRGHRAVVMSGMEMSDIQELYLMTLCHSAIIANSSFSWWGAYLGPHQRGGSVVAPKMWFGGTGPQDTQDIYHKSWVVL